LAVMVCGYLYLKKSKENKAKKGPHEKEYIERASS